MNGTIKHGLEFLAVAAEREPTSYYSRDSGIGVAIKSAQTGGPLRVGVIGLGAGTIAAYGRAGDRYTFYEINPLDVEVANQQFNFLRDSPQAPTSFSATRGFRSSGKPRGDSTCSLSTHFPAIRSRSIF